MQQMLTLQNIGAKGDSITLNTIAIQKAIDDCNKSGGGKVIFPAGKYLSGTIVIKDNVTLNLQKNAVILGSTNLEDYQNLDPFTDGLGIRCRMGVGSSSRCKKYWHRRGRRY